MLNCFRMSKDATSSQITRYAFVWTNILNAPFWAIFNMLPFILYKDMHATPLQVATIIALKPLVSLISLYWSALIEKRPDRLLSNVIWARLIGHLPFLFFPFIENVWFFVASFGFYMMLARGTVPAWMEILKQNIPQVSRERVFAVGSAFGYVGNALLPFVVGPLMDTYFQAWRWIFPAFAVISMAAIFIKARIPIQKTAISPEDAARLTVREQLIQPWKSAWNLLKRRPDFRRYQLGFMLGGSGLIIIQPALPVFFMDVLNLSYTELAVALTLCKGVGFAVMSPVWAQWINRMDIFKFNGLVTFLAASFPLFLLAATGNLMWLYLGYIFYGMMQAGSEMSWNLSGPIFARHEDSSVYSSVNVLTVGLRGSFIPALGSLICTWSGSFTVMAMGIVLCVLGSAMMIVAGRRYANFGTGDDVLSI